jgi:cytoskeletal protein RodZ
MTARHNIRIGNRRLGRDRAAIDATPAPRVGDMLQNAREHKGVDLFRAERDTKIRLKYLAALEDSEYDALPPLVYTKGFLRNYAIYLGLDPEDVLARWRDETQAGRKAERPAVAPPPQPLAAPRRGVAITPGLFVAGMFSLIVVAVFVWIGWQLVRFADVPTLSLTSPTAQVVQVDQETFLLAGVSGPRAEIRITTPDGQIMTVVADENGNWSREVDLSKGQNNFTIIASDAVTHRPSAALNVIINVPLPGASPGATVAPTPAPIRLTLGAPAEGLVVADGNVTVAGNTTGTRLIIETTYLGPADAPATPPASALPGASSTPGPTPTEAAPTPTLEPGTSPFPTGSPPAPTLRDITVDSSGLFSQTLAVPPGRWQIKVTASATGVAALSLTRTVMVRPTVVAGMTVVLTAARGDSWLRMIPDGVIMKANRWGGPTLKQGESITVSAVAEIYIRTGNGAVLDVTVNGQPVHLTGDVGNWIFRPGLAPENTSERR